MGEEIDPGRFGAPGGEGFGAQPGAGARIDQPNELWEWLRLLNRRRR